MNRKFTSLNIIGTLCACPLLFRRPYSFFFFERSRELEIPPSLGNVFFKKPKKNWRNLSLHSLQLLNHLKEFLFPPFFSLSRDIVAQVEREGKGGEMFCPSAATAAYPR